MYRSYSGFGHIHALIKPMYSKTRHKRPLKNRQNKDLKDKW